MADYYEKWLGLWGADRKQAKEARKVIYPEELSWVRTKQDFKSALLVAPDTGFRTLGGVTMEAEIPSGWKTGRHAHGEEAMYIMSGKGFSVIGGTRYDWEAGSCIRIPYGAEHQHFNSGDDSVRYFSALSPYLENFCGIAKFGHLEDCGEYSKEPESPASKDGHDSAGRRIVMRREEAQVGHHGEERERVRDRFDDTHPHQMHKVQHGKIVKLMGGYPDFVGDEVEITDIFFDKPRTASEKHAHMEAILYILAGTGYSIVDDVKYDWRPGTVLHVQGPQTVHQHFNTGDVESQQLRTHFVIRKFFQPVVKDVFPYLYFEEGRPLGPEHPPPTSA